MYGAGLYRPDPDPQLLSSDSDDGSAIVLKCWDCSIRKASALTRLWCCWPGWFRGLCHLGCSEVFQLLALEVGSSSLPHTGCVACLVNWPEKSVGGLLQDSCASVVLLFRGVPGVPILWERCSSCLLSWSYWALYLWSHFVLVVDLSSDDGLLASSLMVLVSMVLGSIVWYWLELDKLTDVVAQV